MADILVVYMRIESKPNFNRFLGCLSKGQSSDDRNGALMNYLKALESWRSVEYSRNRIPRLSSELSNASSSLRLVLLTCT